MLILIFLMFICLIDAKSNWFNPSSVVEKINNVVLSFIDLKANLEQCQHELYQRKNVLKYMVGFIEDLSKQLKPNTSFIITVPVHNQCIFESFLEKPDENIEVVFQILGNANITHVISVSGDVHSLLDWLKNNIQYIVFSIQIILTIYLSSIVHISWKILCKITILTIFSFSYIITYMRMLRQKQAERHAILTKISPSFRLPKACRPDSLSSFDVVKNIITSFVTYNEDQCATYFKHQQVNLYLEISPLSVLSDTLSRFFVQPMSYIGEACGQLLQKMFETLPVYLYGPAFCFLILVIFFTQLMLSGYRLNIFNLISIGPHNNQDNQLRLRVQDLSIQITKIELLLNNIIKLQEIEKNQQIEADKQHGKVKVKCASF